MLKSLRDTPGLKVKVLERGHGVGGTWYWNRYPGARCDSDCYIYCFTFDKQLLQDWTWSERYPEQPEILRYLEHCTQRFERKAPAPTRPERHVRRFAPLSRTRERGLG